MYLLVHVCIYLSIDLSYLRTLSPAELPLGARKSQESCGPFGAAVFAAGWGSLS